MALPIKTVGVIGTGVIGASWTSLFLARGLKVIVSDPAPGAEKRLSEYLKKAWGALESIGIFPGAALTNYKFVGTSLDGYYDKVDFIQENAPERLDIKTKLFAEIDAGTRPDVIIASSSSGLPSSRFVSDCKVNPGRVLIGHPFNPPHLMPLVEVVPHPGTSKNVSQQALEFYRLMGKRPILVTKEVPGFVANRLQVAVLNEAYSLVHRGIVSAEEVDACMTTGLGPRWALIGPFMTNVLGGGGGKEGFSHVFNNLGPAGAMWTDDMMAHAFDYKSEDNLSILDASVQQMLENFDPKEVEEQRDRLLIDLLKAKQNSNSIV